MEYTELTGYHVPAGVVTTWIPTCPDEAWRDDPRGLSPAHEQHLAGGETGAWIGSVMRVPRAYDALALGRALTAWTARHEVLRTTPAAGADGWRRRTAPAGQVRVEPTEVGWVGSDHVNRYVGDFFAGVSPLRWPHCRFVTVLDPDADGGFVLAFGADHSVMDAYSQLLWFEEVLGLYDRALAGASEAELAEHEVGSHVDFSDGDRSLALALDADAAPVARWREFLGDELAFPRLPVDGIETTARLPQTTMSAWVADRDGAEAFTRACRAAGGSGQSGVLAAFSHAVRERHGVDRLRYILPMHTRDDAKDLAAVGWYVGLCPVDVDLSDLEPGATPRHAPALLARAGAAVEAGRDLVRYPFARVAALLGVTDVPHLAISYVDTRYVPGAAEWPQWQARALRSTEHAGDEVYLWFIRSHEGLSVSARYPATLVAERTMRGLVETFADTVARLSQPEVVPAPRVEVGIGAEVGIGSEATA